MSVPGKPFWLSAAGSEAGVGKPFWMSNGTIRALVNAGIPYWVSGLAGSSATIGVSLATTGGPSSYTITATATGGSGSYSYSWSASGDDGTPSISGSGATITARRGGNPKNYSAMSIFVTVTDNTGHVGSAEVDL